MGENRPVLFPAARFQRSRSLADASFESFVVEFLEIGQMRPEFLEASRVEGLAAGVVHRVEGAVVSRHFGVFVEERVEKFRRDGILVRDGRVANLLNRLQFWVGENSAQDRHVLVGRDVAVLDLAGSECFFGCGREETRK